MRRAPRSVVFLAVVFVVFPFLDGVAGPLTSEFLDGSMSWSGHAAAALILLGLVSVFSGKHG